MKYRMNTMKDAMDMQQENAKTLAASSVSGEVSNQLWTEL